MFKFIPRRIYTVLLWLLLPYIFFHLLWRARKQPEYLKHIAERFGFYSTHSNKPVIWLHTVSVGETRAAASLVHRLREAYPEHQLLLTHTTPTGRAASKQLYGDDVLRVYLPYDYPFAVKRFLNHFRPRIGVLLETEIWFNLIHACHAGEIPLLLINARLSEKSARGYKHFERLTRDALEKLTAIAAQSEDDAARLTALGGRNVFVMGNLKFDIEPPAAMLKLGRQLRSQFGESRKIFLAASTREGEEELLLNTLWGPSFPRRRESSGLSEEMDSRLRGNDKIKTILAAPGFLLVIVPRHPQRFDEVAALFTQHGICFQRRSENRPIAPDTQVVLGDSMGEMFAYYAACDLAFIGGSLLPFGGQNLIEACAVGKPVLIGPHTHNFAQASQLAIASGAALRVQDASSLAQMLQDLLAHPGQLAEIGDAGLRFVNANRGATEHALLHISHLITK